MFYGKGERIQVCVLWEGREDTGVYFVEWGIGKGIRCFEEKGSIIMP